MSSTAAPARPRALRTTSTTRRTTRGTALAGALLAGAATLATTAVTAPAASAATAGAAPRTATRVALPALVTRADVVRVRAVAPQLRRLRGCESSGNYRINTGNGYYGAYQFDLGTWRGLGYRGYPHQASALVQDAAAAKLHARRGWRPWPACSRMLGLR